MKKREIWLADKIDELGASRAHATGIDVAAFYANLISDSLLEGGSPNTQATLPNGEMRNRRNIEDPPQNFRPRTVNGLVDGDERQGLTLEEISPDHFQVVGISTCDVSTYYRNEFDVSRAFRGFPSRSISYAQRLVDEALTLPDVIAEKSKDGNGIAFKPNFLFIEALLQRKSGIRVSLYGQASTFAGAPESLGPGRTGSYRRIVVTNDDDLEKLLPLIRQAYDSKFASGGARYENNSL